MINLSICIPSYNREKFLPDLLHSIVSQYNEHVEIVICDNGSTDGTEALVHSWKEQHPRIVYEKFSENRGPDRCFLRTVELASGTFCWLMGDDDIIEPEGLQTVLSSLKNELSGITVRRAAYNVLLQKRWMEPSTLTKDLLFQDATTCLSSLFSLFGFLSAQIINRQQWLSVIEEEDVSSYFNAYVLIYIIGRMIQKKPHWLYLHSACVGWRSGNDSFAKELGRYGRFELDVLGYTQIALGLFHKDKKMYQAIMNKICKTHLSGHIRDLKCGYKRSYPLKALSLCLPKLYDITAFWWKIVPLLFFPGCLAKLICRLKI